VSEVDEQNIVVEQYWNDTDKGKAKFSEEHLLQCHFVHHIPT